MSIRSKLNVFVCLTYPQYVIADIFAKEIYRNDGQGSLIILKYISMSKPKEKRYAKYLIIQKNFIGKIITGFFSYFAMCVFLLKKNISLYYFNDRDPISIGISKISKKTILIEEGMGTYYDAPSIPVIGKSIPPDIAYIGYPELYRKTHNDNTKLIKIIYKELYSELNMKSYFKQEGFHASGDLLILGQTTEDCQKLREYEINFINNLLERFPDKKIIIKPHPRDLHPEEYNRSCNCLIIESGISNKSIESIMYNIDCNNYFSLFSSAGITVANVFQNSRVIFGIGIYDIGFGVTCTQLINFTKYLNNIYFPDSIEDVINILGW
ncbi:MAG: polysialyltransferase family glycosyltransferase [Lachnospiraceae bacterium]|nr:polysialyltransferase family glycosyltransferase [Lachnospiraceae bacterium]